MAFAADISRRRQRRGMAVAGINSFRPPRAPGLRRRHNIGPLLGGQTVLVVFQAERLAFRYCPFCRLNAVNIYVGGALVTSLLLSGMDGSRVQVAVATNGRYGASVAASGPVAELPFEKDEQLKLGDGELAVLLCPGYGHLK